MNKIISVFLAISLVIIFSNCHGSRKAMASSKKSTFDTDMRSMMITYCSNCHIPSKGGNKKAYDNYTNTKEDIADIIRRIELEPGQRGFMPKGRPRLNDSTINAIKRWRDQGLQEH